MNDPEPGQIWLTRPDGLRLAVCHQAGAHPRSGPAVLFLHGLKSDMQGVKAASLAAAARVDGWEFLRLDLSGHGSSDGAFEDCTITRWVEDAQIALDQLAGRPAVLVGSSLGGWIALRLALRAPDHVAGLLLVAPAVDMTRRIRNAMTREDREMLDATGVWERPSQWSGPIALTQAMFEDGERHCLLDRPIRLECPVRILHGQKDTEVPWQGSLELADRLASNDVRTVLIKNGDHRLSDPAEIALLTTTLAELRDTCSRGALVF